MDGETAGRVIREQDAAVCGRLRPLLEAQARRTDAMAETLTPWLDRVWVRQRSRERPGDSRGPLGILRPEAVRVVYDARAWGSYSTNPAPVTGQSWWELRQQTEFLEYRFPNMFLVEDHSAGDMYADKMYPRGYVESSVRRLRDDLRELARRLREERPARVIPVPDDVRAPRHARLSDGVLARLLAEDLRGQIARCEALDASLAAGASAPPLVERWRRETAEFLRRRLGEEAALGFTRVTRGAAACANPLVPDPNSLAQAYLSFGRAYLEEVRERMPDYAEASGQSRPEQQVNISGGTFVNAQFAGRIKNIDSTIAGVVQQGAPQLAEALKALERAVLGQAGLADDTRAELLDNVEYLAEAARTPPERRNRGLIRSVLAALTTAATGGEELHRALEAWGGVLRGILP
ncbi:hypothetical protein [Streptomyces humi]